MMPSSQVLFCPPRYFRVIDQKNPYMKPGEPIDLALATRQWEDVRAAFAAAGCATEVIEPAAELEDMVFAANQTFTGQGADGKKFVIPSYMRHESRRREVPHFVEWFTQRGYEVIDLHLPPGEHIEGGGDLLQQPGTNQIWAGYGFRSSKYGIERFKAAMEQRGITAIPLELVDERFYHLDTCLAPLNKDAVLIYRGAFSAAALCQILQNAERVYDVSEEEALGFVCNGVAVNGSFLTPRVTPTLKKALKAEGLKAVEVNTSEFEKSGGSVCCLKSFI
jgi:N-dimethylarginine dimethylaminohydrolase